MRWRGGSYPLSLNALTNACNQKTNRHPVLELGEQAVQETLDALSKRHLVMEGSGFGLYAADQACRLVAVDLG